MDSLENRDLVTDGSQTDPESITMGALRGCENTGTVQADRNVGGIAGAMGMEAGADPESDVSKSLSSTERKQYELRAVCSAAFPAVQSQPKRTARRRSAAGWISA